MKEYSEAFVAFDTAKKKHAVAKDPIRMLRFMPFVVILAMLPTGCGSVGNANLGPDPAGGF